MTDAGVLEAAGAFCGYRGGTQSTADEQKFDAINSDVGSSQVDVE